MTARRVGLVVALSCLAGFVVVAAVWVPWSLLPGLAPAPAVRPDELLSAAQLSRAQAYTDPQRWLGLASTAVSLVLALVLGLTAWGARLVGRLRGWWWVRVALGTLLVLALGRLLTLPFSWVARQRAIDVGLSRQSVGSWAQDVVTNLLVNTVYAAIAAIVLIGLARWLPRTWPAWGALVSGALVVLGSFVYPVVVEPLNNDFRSLPDGALRSDVLALARTEGVRVDDVLVADASRRTTALNAYVTGFGDTRRVVLWDNTVKDLPRAQVLSIVAHELGHARHDDVLTGTVLGALGAGFGVGLLGVLLTGRLTRRAGTTGPGDPRVLALLLALTTLGSLASAPVENAISRSIEARADLDALRATRNPTAFEAMQVRLVRASLGEPDPPRLYQLWFGSHPTTLQRVAMARAYANGERP